MNARNRSRQTRAQRKNPSRRHAVGDGRSKRAALFEQLEPRLVLAAVTAGEAGTFDLDDVVADRLLIKLREDIVAGFGNRASAQSTESASDALPASLTALLDVHAVSSSLRQLFELPAASAALSAEAARATNPAETAEWQAEAASIGLDRWFQIDLVAGADLAAVRAAFAADAAVEIAEPDFFFRLNGLLGDPGSGSAAGGSGSSTSSDSDSDSSTHSLPSGDTDPNYGQQWHLDAINAPEAWAHLESLGLPAGGSSDIVVAVIDTGVDYTHPDLAANMWVNPLEVAANATDDDGNGFKDDIHGVAVVSDSRSHSGNPMDDNGHGTHVAGIIAASANNSIGGTGVAFNAKIMAIKSFGYAGTGTSTDIAEGIYYAVENGADIINMSFGSYSESSLVKDALQVAFGTSVLVAAAGNDGRGNLSCPPQNPPPADMFPAAYNWVLGVMASTPQGGLAAFSNHDCLPNDAHEYELLAPGAGISSTVPGGSYSAWSGTSMAAPVVSGIAALLRTKFADTDLYSSRFIMGQLAVGRGSVIDAEQNLTDTPEPNLTYRDHLLFDTTAVEAGNDNDGRVDAGETVDLALTIRNHWGAADNVTVTLDAIAEGAVAADPYVTMITDTVNYGSIGTFNEDDNGLIYEDGAITGVSSPFQFTVADDTPNDHVIAFRITINGTNGLDPADQTVYSFTSRFTLTVQRGREVPSVISEDMALTKDDFWIVTGPVLIEPGTTLTISPGTQVQWGGSSAASPYANPALEYIQVEGTLLVAGTAEEPVRLFASDTITIPEFGRPSVRIYNLDQGVTHISHAHITHPELGLINKPPIDSISYSLLDGDGTERNSLFLRNGYERHRPGLSVFAQQVVESRIAVERLSWVERGMVPPWFEPIAQYDTVLIDSITGTSGSVPQFRVSDMSDSVLLPDMDEGLKIRLLNNTQTTEELALADTSVRSNAFLSPYWNTNTETWTRFISSFSRDKYFGLTGNYWGGASDELIDLAVVDYFDDFNYGKVLASPSATTAPESVYPFVTDVRLTREASGNLSVVDAGAVTFTVTFNRDMDQTVQPQVGFGPAFPYTDYTVAGDWVDARTWQGSFNVTPLTGDGYQLIRVAGAQALEKPWLVTGNDAGRFRFEIVTSGTLAMNLQASGGEGKVDLSWTQDDFDLLAGYNIYRATSLDGPYTRVNSTIIPKEETSFTDTSVAPAQTYFYKFRIVKTDSTESVDSNVASAAPVDTIAPVITHTAVTESVPNVGITIRADVTDNLTVQSATLHYRAIGESTYATRAMTNTTGSRYSVSLDASVMAPPGIEYYLSASDGVTTVYHGLEAQPHRIDIADRPSVTSITPASGPSTGGTSVTITGSNFKAGASVTIGGGVASDVVVVSSTQITATTPAGVPAHADVTVINPGDVSHTLLGGFLFEADGALLALPTTTAESGGTVEIPITLSGASSLLSSEIVIAFDAAVLTATSARVGPLADGWTLATNTSVAGQVTLSLAGATSVSATGTLAFVTFDVIGAPTTASDLTITSATLNDGAITTQTTAGRISVNEVYEISGLVRYFADSAAIEGVSLFLEGEASGSATSSATGAYAFTSLQQGDYTLAPDKQSDVRGITAYDAALVLQAVAGLTTLSDNEQIAANVNRRDDVTALDAAYILQKAVGLIAGSFPNAGTNWVFTPAQRAFTGLAADQTSQHFTGILLGDLSGNWADAGGGGGQGSSVQATPSVVSIGSGLVTAAGGSVQLPVTLARGDADIYAADLTITYDPTKVSVSDNPVTLGNAAAGMTLAVNAETPGILRIALASPTAIPADGTLLLLDLVAAADLSADVTVSFGATALNEGRVTLSAEDGSIVVDTVAPTAAFGSVTSPRSTAVDSITLEFSEQVTGVSLDALALTRDGKKIPLANATLTGSGTNYTLSGLEARTATHGDYQLILAADGSVTDPAGNTLAAAATLEWSVDTSVHVGEGSETTDTTTRTGDYRLVKRGKGRLVLDRPNSHTEGTVIEEGEVVVRHITALGSGRLEVRTGAIVTLDLHTDRATLGGIDLAEGGHIDIGLGGLQLPTGSYDLATIRQQILAARNGGRWDGAGIGSSLLTGFGSTRQVGYRVALDGTLAIAWAANGDGTLDGRIDSRDINALLLSGLFNTPATNGHWYQGDFTYDGRVNSLDISRLLLTGLMNTGSYLPARGQGEGASATGLGSGGGSGAATGDPDSSGDAATNSTGSASTSSVMGPEPPPSHSRGNRAVLVRPPTASSLDATQLAFAAIAVSPESPGNAKPNAELLRP